MARYYTAEEMRHRLKHYYKYMFTRHPLDRVLSAYKDKLQVVMSLDTLPSSQLV